ncbi:MAG TPA: zinc-ribbon domain-containing protein [Butyricicoccus pullicaecorum]|nr:zinc-ribbon domain-containing protein [Butyricicoccus pullicaecorum]
MASQFPEIAAQWHPEKNGILTPQQVTPCSNRKIWWKCELGHSYQAMIGARTRSRTGCPYCTGRKVLSGFNDLATLHLKIAKQWHTTLYGTLTPDSVTVGSHRKVW